MRAATAVAQKEDHITQTTHPMLSDGIVARVKEELPGTHHPTPWFPKSRGKGGFALP